VGMVVKFKRFTLEDHVLQGSEIYASNDRIRR
jgi:hypothetical protein